MLKMKKYAWLVALLLALSLAFVACGGNGNGREDEDEDEDIVEVWPSPPSGFDVTLITVSQTDIPGGLNDVPADERDSGKGFIFGDDFDKIKAAEAGSRLFITVSGTINLNWDSIGAVGIGAMEGNENNRIDFKPDSAGGLYAINISASDVFALDGGAEATVIHVNVWGGHVIRRVQLLTPQEEMFIPVEDITGVSQLILSPEYTLDGRVSPADATNRAIAWSIKEDLEEVADLTGAELVFSGEGTITVTATIVNGLTESSDFTRDFVITYVDLPDLDATFVGSGPVIGFNGYDGELEWALFTESTHIVFAFKGIITNGDAETPTPNRDGFGGMQIALQFRPNVGESDWHQYGTPGWADFSNDGEETVFYVFPMNALVSHGHALAADDAKIILNSGFNHYMGAWLTDKPLAAANVGGVMHGLGWITRVSGLEKE
jgi:hypothetical protein